MKKYLTCGWVIFMLAISFTASGQWGRYHGRYTSRHYSYPNRHYSYPRYGYDPRTSVSIIGRLPFGAISLNFGNHYYHYYNGIYYRPYSSGYVIVEPPIGIIVPALPYGSAYIVIGSHPYYRYGNAFYAPYGNRYRVVERPDDVENSSSNNDKTDNSISNEYEKIVIEGKTYYKKGDKYYKASVNKDGEIVYEEVGEISKSK
jgi:hypothetical protein